jgi:CHAT domain-containing protein
MRALVVGNPAIDTVAGVQLALLPAARKEAQSIAPIYPTSMLLLDKDARRDSVLDLLSDYDVFHFAGHAVFNSEQPELSYLALAPGGPESSGILLAREIGNKRLSNVKLVVLAACSTLNPRTTRVGAVAGLAHSFLRAGAPAIVSSIWDVDDAATAELLLEFHKNFARDGDAARALRDAQLAALKSAQPERRAIRNWAAFIYTGN